MACAIAAGAYNECVSFGDVQRLDAFHRHDGAGREGVHWVTELTRKCERLLCELARRLDVDDDHDATPICCSIATTAGAASGPWPRITASLP